MSEDRVVEILKSAILLERRGRTFYRKVSRDTGSRAVSSLFETMAEEEDRHMELLSQEFAGYTTNKRFEELELPEGGTSLEEKILSGEIRRQIGAASYEAAAISAAMELENQAVRLYSQRADATKDGAEKRLYRWLSDWEQGHLKMLAEINRELLEEIWYDSHFWPF